jgi:ABC-type antimicrobial peptide transport system permease subunit
MVLVESLIVAFFAAGTGGLFAWWSAPFVVRMISPPDSPARLVLSADWRVLGFGVALIVIVTLLFGLLPALRASAVKPVNALKGEDDPHSRRRRMHGMIAVQVAFCFLVVFWGGLFVSTLNKLSHVPIGFSAERLVALETVTHQGLVEALVFRQGFLTAMIGLAFGLGITLALMGILRGMLPGLESGKSGGVWIEVALVALTAALGCWLPARRAAKIDPMLALRQE